MKFRFNPFTRTLDYYGGGDSTCSGTVSTGNNLGSGEGIYAGNSGSVLLFKSLDHDSYISVTSTASEINLGANLTSFDSRYYPQSSFINSSAGSSDAGKPIVLDSDGKIDASMVDDSDIDHGNLTGLGDDDHLQYLNNARHNAISGNVHDVKLDDAYDGESGSGSGRVITADSGPVVIDSSGSTDAPFRIVQQTSLPSTNLAAGDFGVKDGMLFVYDSSRSKYLSMPRLTLLFGRNGSGLGNQYLRMINGTSSSNVGFRIPRDATIVSAGVQTRYNVTADFRIRRNSNATNLYVLSVNNTTGTHANNINIDLDEGDYVQVHMRVVSGTMANPMMLIELAYRD